jgi:hypothetical protein
MDQESIDKLDRWDYKPFHDGFVAIHFSDPKRGLHGCCPAELLHTFHMGIAERSIISVFDIRKMKKTATRHRRDALKALRMDETTVMEDEMEEDEMSVASDDDEFILNDLPSNSGDEGSVLDPNDVMHSSANRKVFNKKAKDRVDLLAKRLHRYLRWQSETNLPRTAFGHGITSLVKLQGAERTGVLIVLFIIMIMEHWGDFEKNVDPNRTANDEENTPGYIERSMGAKVAKNLVKSLYLLITFEAFLRSESIPYDCLRKVESFIPVFLDQIIRTFPRSEGSGNNLIKNHLFLHLVHDIKRLGVPSNTNSAIGEMCHKVICKETGRRTNMSALTFEKQTSVRYVENLTILRAFCDHPEWTDGREEKVGVYLQKAEATYHCKITVVGSNYITGKYGKKLYGRIPDWSDSAVSSQEIIDLIRTQVLPHIPGREKEVQLFGKTIRNDVSFSCCPSYGKQGLAKQDWCFVEMDEGENIPFQILVIFYLPECRQGEIKINGVELSGKGYYALGHFGFESLRDQGAPSLYQGAHDNEGNRAHVDQYLVHRMSKWHFTDDNPVGIMSSKLFPPTISVIPCETIAGPCLAFPDIVSSDPENLFYFLKPVGSWSQLFIEAADRHFMKKR